MDSTVLVTHLIEYLDKLYPNAIKNRYGIEYDENTPVHEIYEKIAVKRGFLKKGGEVDYKRTADIVIDEFRAGTLGKMTLESVSDLEKNEN